MANQWYVVHTYSGYEDRVKNSLEQTLSNLDNKDSVKIYRILVPTEDVVDVRGNKKTIKKKKFFPGYVFIEMTLNNDVYWIIRNTAGVTGFLGGVKPVPIAQEEVKNLLNIVNRTNSDAKPRLAISFEKNEQVRINEGPFKHFVGEIAEINANKAKLRVMVNIFGRAVPVELNFLQVEKV
ncbi:MAG: transcription termination/antitermination protein NusG [Elusimicrobiota bacterium]|jgi:transcriptional antiterminator NusG|nr:transcription termination/antitermination protein NusG [Elusimicrobiota bacterium]